MNGYVSWYERSGDGLVGMASAYTTSASILATGDMDFDGRGDAVVVRNDGYINWLEYDGAGGLAPIATEYVGSILDIAVGDIDGDGNGDVAVLRNDGYVFWYERNVNALTGIASEFVGATAVSIDLGDLDGDGFDDLAVGRSDGYVLWYKASGSSLSGIASYYVGATSLVDVKIASVVQAAPGCSNQPSADLNDDCIVDFKDFAILASEWLDCGLDPVDACTN
jgi:hypothetical protein